jgi:S-DNA-T family DNA segregation ATPase FtsK/SpoIIIE
MGRKDKLSIAQEVGAIILIGAAVLVFLSLFSFAPQQVGWAAGGREVANYIGPLGAHMGGALYAALGVAAWVAPCLMMLWGVGLWVNPQLCGPWKIVWGALLLVSLSCLVEVQPWFFHSVKENLSLYALGGMTGHLLVNSLLSPLIGRAGTAILFGVIYAIGMVVVVNLRPSDWFMLVVARFAEAYQDWRGARESGNRRKPQQEEFPGKRKLAVSDGAEVEEEDERAAATKEHFAKLPPPQIKDATTAPAKATRKPREEDALLDEQEGEVNPPLPKVPAPKFTDVSAPLPPPKPSLATKLLAKKKTAEKSADSALSATFSGYKLPTPELLNMPPTDRPTVSKEDLMRNAEVLCATLADFDIPVQMGDVTRGPTITRFEVYPGPGVKLERIVSLQNNIAAAMKAGSVNIVAPVPGKGTVGIEVPNSASLTVYSREMYESEAWHNAKGRIPLALGRDVYGEPIIGDLAEMPHLLIAGSTGSGKSVCINSLVTSMLFRHSPEDLRFIMIDPKIVELQVYSSLPHLAVPVVTDPKKVIFALRWAVNEMERRYQTFAKANVRDIKAFNARPKKSIVEPEPELPLEPEKNGEANDSPANEGNSALEISVPRDAEPPIPDKFPYIVIIIDELADLMLVAPADVETAIARITQMGRAAGIHVIVATQRPSVDVITGVVKNNIPARIAFQVAAKVDSRTILDVIGAEKLLGRGDMLYMPPGTSKLVRAQGVLVADDEIKRVVDFCAKQGKQQFVAEIVNKLSGKDSGDSEAEDVSEEDEELIEKSIEVIRQTKRASVSMLQRRLRIGYTRAARIMDLLEERGIVGPGTGSEPREILVDLDAGVPAGTKGETLQNENQT